jgi:hypothetical protein
MWYLTPTEPVQLAKKIQPPPLVPLVVVAIEDLFDICLLVHRNIGHQGVSGMEKEAKKFYYNVSRPIITIFLKYSNEYQIKRRKIKTAGQVHKPIISEQYNSRAQIDLVDMSSLPDNSHDPPYRYIFNCQDHLTKFCHLRPCVTKGAVEVANHLYHIFCEFGAPIILHSDNGLEFRNQVVNALKLVWPGLHIVHGRSRTPTTQGSVERSNGDFQGQLGSWMRENNNPHWSLGLPLVMHQKNRKFHKGIGTSPYNALFGKEAYNGLELINLPATAKEKIKNIKDLYNVLLGMSYYFSLYCFYACII